MARTRLGAGCWVSGTAAPGLDAQGRPIPVRFRHFRLPPFAFRLQRAFILPNRDAADREGAVHGSRGEPRRLGELPLLWVVGRPDARQVVEIAADTEVDGAALEGVADGGLEGLVLGVRFARVALGDAK